MQDPVSGIPPQLLKEIMRLRAINGFSHLLEEHVRGGLDEEGHRLIDNIRRGERRMESLISALLELSRASRGKLSVVPIDVNDLVREVLAEVIPQDEGAKVDVRLSDLPPASGDLGLVRQVFRNLLGNAVKFSSHREHPVVEVGGTVRDGLREYFVKDNGVGFDPSHAGKLFRTFERLHTDREFEGTGIGLSIVHRIVERHGGRAWAEGRVDGGATFWFTLGAVASES